MTLAITITGNRVSFGARRRRLTPIEAGILRRLAEARGAVVPYEVLVAHLKRSEDGVKAIHAHVCYLRAKLRQLGPKHIVLTAHGEGYRFNAETFELRDESPVAGIFVPMPIAAQERLADLAQGLGTQFEPLLEKVLRAGFDALHERAWNR